MPSTWHVCGVAVAARGVFMEWSLWPREQPLLASFRRLFSMGLSSKLAMCV